MGGCSLRLDYGALWFYSSLYLITVPFKFVDDFITQLYYVHLTGLISITIHCNACMSLLGLRCIAKRVRIIANLLALLHCV